MQKEKKQSFMQGIVTLMFSQIIIKIFGLIYKLYLTNKSGFGDSGNAIYSSAFQIYALLLTVSSIGIPNAVAKLVSEKISIGDYRGAHRIFKIAFATFSVIGFLTSSFLFLNAEYIAVNWLEMPQATLSLLILAPSIFFVSVISVLRGYFNGRENMKPMANSQTIEQLSKTIFTVIIVESLCIFMGFANNTEVLAAGANIATTFATFISFIYLIMVYIGKRKQIYYEIRHSSYKSLNKKEDVKNKKVIKVVSSILIIAMPMTISAILGSLNRNIDAVTVVRGLKNFLTLEEAQRQYGILSGKVETLVTFPLSFNIAFATALIPTIASSKAARNFEAGEKRIKLSILITILTVLPCTIGMVIFAKQILQMLFPNASDGSFIYQISAISIIFTAICQTICGALQGLGKVFTPVISFSAGIIVKLILNLILVPIDPNNFILGGTAGAAFATLISHVVSLIISINILKKNINLKIDKLKFILKPIIASCGMGICAYITYIVLKGIFIDSLATILSIVFAVLIYVFLVLILRIFSKEELYMIPYGNKIISNYENKRKK